MKTCANCSTGFTIRPEDRAFYARMDVPEPSHCPDCRAQRRLAFRNQNKLYKRKCDFSGEDMISLYSPDKPYKVYKESVWWSDAWNPMDYGRDFDFSRPFFEQFNELILDVPRRGMHQDGSNENCEYITFGMSNKNCYLAFTCFYSENVYFCTMVAFSKDCVDCQLCTESQLLYSCIDCDKCYAGAYLKNCISCSDSYLMDDCRNCQNCICCKNLRNKKYHVYNRPVSKEEFEALRAKIMSGGAAEEKTRFDKWKLGLPFLYARIRNSDNCIGDFIENAKDCYYSFDLILGAENCNYCQTAGWQGKDMWDCSRAGKESNFVYELHAAVGINNSAFLTFARLASDSYYCDCVASIDNCFGCSGIQHKKYCILNKQYSREEYEALLPRIIEHMRQTGEWGEFFPIEISPFGFNETTAQEYYPMTREAVLAKGWKWKDEEPASPKPPTSGALTCETCGKNFKFISQASDLMRKIGFPLPQKCHDCRYEDLFNERNPYKLWKRECSKCGVAIQTSYSPDRPETIFCEKCYLKEVY